MKKFSPAFEDSSMTANVSRGETYTLTVKGNTVGQFEHDIRAFLIGTKMVLLIGKPNTKPFHCCLRPWKMM